MEVRQRSERDELMAHAPNASSAMQNGKPPAGGKRVAKEVGDPALSATASVHATKAPAANAAAGVALTLKGDLDDEQFRPY